MTRLFVYTEPFRKCWRAMGLEDESLKDLEEIFLENLGEGMSLKDPAAQENCGFSYRTTKERVAAVA